MSSSYLRAKARQILAGKWGMAVLAAIVAGILGGLLTSSSAEVNINLDAQSLETIPGILRTYLAIAASIGGTLGMAQFIIGGTVQLGYCKYLLKLHDGEEAEISDLFSEFHRFADGFVLSLLTGIYVFLWSLLFVIPGIIAALKYAMAPFILLENPGMKPSEAITASKELMDGFKGDLFILDLSFIGWQFLSALTLGIGSLWLDPYMNTARACFYRQLSPILRTPEPPKVTWGSEYQPPQS